MEIHGLFIKEKMCAVELMHSVVKYDPAAGTDVVKMPGVSSVPEIVAGDAVVYSAEPSELIFMFIYVLLRRLKDCSVALCLQNGSPDVMLIGGSLH